MASSGGWIVYWTFLAIFTIIGYPFFHYSAMSALLIVMRARDNQLPRQAWVAFWLTAAQAWWPVMFMPLTELQSTFHLWLLAIVRFGIAIHSEEKFKAYEMPTKVFWILFAFMVPTILRPYMTLGCYMLVATLMYNVHMGPNGLHLPGVTVTGWLFIALAAVILVGVHGKYTLQYLPSVLIFFSIAVLLHNQMWPYNKDFGYVWFIAWIVLYKSITLVFAPYIVFQPVIWYSSWVVIVAMLGWAFRPDQSLTRFMLWAATIYVLRSVLFLIVLTYFPGDNRRASLFPFNLFSGTWRVSRERWLALVELPKENPEQVPGGDSGQFPENESERRALCERCNIIVASSKLITGSETYLTRLTEWHEFRTTKEFVDSFAKPEQNTNSATQEAKPAEEAVGNLADPRQTSNSATETLTLPKDCHLCCLLWYSMSPPRQQDIAKSCMQTGTTVAVSETQRQDAAPPRCQQDTSEGCTQTGNTVALSEYQRQDDTPSGHRQDVAESCSQVGSTATLSENQPRDDVPSGCQKNGSESCKQINNPVATSGKKTQDDTPFEVIPLSRPTNPSAGLRIKVWEERPLTPYTYTQLYWGDVAIGSRLLVHRGNLLPTQSPSIEQDNTGSKAHFEQALEWLQSCRESHDLCKGVGNSKPVRPKRMLFVSNGGENYLEPGMPPASIKLMDTCDIDFTKSEYVALSHCWGKTKEVPFTLLASNIEMLYQGIDFFCLSRNLQDAITATLNLGFSYIWIDSLCITQSDKTFQEKEELAHIWEEDWKNEAPKLGGVYSAAACTIASTGSFDCNGGCFHSRNVKALEPCKIGAKPGIKPTAATPDEVIYVRRDDVFDFDRGVNLAPLNTRGWVMQERLLSRRILHFGADMLYWECGCRSASELNHHGYTYKRYPEDFRDHYAPDMSPQNIETRRDLYIAEREGRGLRWHDKEAVRRRPPPPMLHPDSPPSSQEVWLRKRGFWKNVLKSDSEPWTNDESDDRKKRPRAGFRADFELLRLGNAEKIATAVAEELAKYHLSLMAKWLGAEPAPEDESREVGQYSYSQLWYNIIEPYSRCLLTTPTDKLVAIMGLQEEVGRATGSTYLHGLWSQRLATDLLWFAIDGPGQRLRKDGKKPETPAIDGSGKQVGKEQNKPEGPPVAPTWSWASIVGAVALDLMPENSRAHIELKATLLATIRIIDGKDHPSSTAIELYGPVLKIEANWLTFDGTVWGIHAGNTRRPSARFFPDVAGRDEQSRQSLEGAKDLVCLSALVLRRNKSKLAMTSSTEDVQGLVLRSVEETDGAAGNNHGEDNSPKDYVRIGYFTTSYIAKSREAAQGLKALKRAEVKKLCLRGWSGSKIEY